MNFRFLPMPARTLGTMISSGVPILDGLDIVAKTAGNKIVENAIYRVAQSISEGKTIAEPLEKSGVFPPMVCQMIAVGEQSGSISMIAVSRRCPSPVFPATAASCARWIVSAVSSPCTPTISTI